ncbi:MAG: hypothetical protein HC896_18530 [Bacteroidales bacterium]|nr:hypothetical protein [Bacteroidales bacterium]
MQQDTFLHKKVIVPLVGDAGDMRNIIADNFHSAYYCLVSPHDRLLEVITNQELNELFKCQGTAKSWDISAVIAPKLPAMALMALRNNGILVFMPKGNDASKNIELLFENRLEPYDPKNISQGQCSSGCGSCGTGC